MKQTKKVITEKNRKKQNEVTIEDKKVIDQIKSLLLEYKSTQEICELLNFSKTKFYKYKNIATLNGIWLSREEILKIETQKKKIYSNKKVVKKQEELGKEVFIKNIISLIKEGKRIKEIAQIMECSEAHIHKIRRECINNGTWISIEEEKEIKKARRKPTNRKRRNKEIIEKEKEEKQKRREEKEILKQKRILNEKLQYEKKVENELEKIRNLEYIDKNILGENIKPFKHIKEFAKKEDNAEYNGEENISTKGREAFIESMLKLKSLGWNKYTEKDIEIITNSFFIYPELANKDIIKFVILDASEKGGLDSALDALNELMDSLGNTKFYKGLMGYNDWLRKMALIPKIREMKSQGLNNTQIGEKLRITSAEVAVLFDSDEKADYKGFEEI